MLQLLQKLRLPNLNSSGFSAPTSDALEKVMTAYLENQNIEQAERYVRRGRKLANIDTEALKNDWVTAFRQMVAINSGGSREPEDRRREREDIEGELLIRRVAIPYSQVSQEIATIRRIAKERIAALRKDPVRLVQLEGDLQADLAAFQQRNKSGSSN